MTKAKLRTAEMRMLTKLQKDHNYTLMRMKRPADRYVQMFNFKVHAMRPCYIVRFAIPMDSPLAEAMIANDKLSDKKGRKRK
jgi:hypothetical protein